MGKSSAEAWFKSLSSSVNCSRYNDVQGTQSQILRKYIQSFNATDTKLDEVVTDEEVMAALERFHEDHSPTVVTHNIIRTQGRKMPMPKPILTLIAFTALLGSTAAISNDEFSRKILSANPQADRDGDGVLSDLEQAAVVQQILKRYPKVDRDGDGTLSNPEKQNLLRMSANRTKKSSQIGSRKSTSEN